MAQERSTKSGKVVTKQEMQRRKQQSERDKAQHRKNAGAAPQKRQRSKVARQVAIGQRSAIGTMQGNSYGMLLCKQMAMPCNKPTMRMPTQDMPLTSVASFRYMKEVSASDLSTDSRWGNDDMTVIVVGQPGLTYLLGPMRCAGGAKYYEFDFVFTHDGAASDELIPPPGQMLRPEMELNYWAPLRYLRHGGGGKLGAGNLPIARSGDVTYVHIGKGAELVWNTGYTDPAALTTVALDVYIYDGSLTPKSVETLYITNNTTPTGGVVHQFAETGHYAFKYTHVAMETANGQVGLPIQRLKLGLVYRDPKAEPWYMGKAEDLDPVTGDKFLGYKCRRTAISVCVTNTSAEMYKQGNVSAARLGYEGVADITPAALSMAADRYTGPAAKGCFTYMDFTPDAEKFVDVVDGELGDVVSYTLDTEDLAHVMHFSGLAMGATGPASSFIVTTDIAIEFITDKQRYEKETPLLPYEVLVEARRINNSTSYFYENPLHPKDIMRYLSSAWSMFRGNANRIAMGLSAAMPELAPIALPLGKFLQT